jgi:hypothetical protein
MPVVAACRPRSRHALGSAAGQHLRLQELVSDKDALAYLARWQLVRQAEIAELRRTPMDIKLRQLAALMASRGLFHADPKRELQSQQVRERVDAAAAGIRWLSLSSRRVKLHSRLGDVARNGAHLTANLWDVSETLVRNYLG